jgi:peptide/nickel transport system permease protein
MLSYIIKRLLQLIPPLFGLTIILFVLLRISGDPIYHLVDPEASAEEIEEVRIAYGFDKPLIEQYLNQLKMIFNGDFGNSFRFKTPAMPLVLERLPATIELAFFAIIISILIAIPAGVLSAIYQNSLLDYIVTIVSTIGRAMPNFWIGIMLILLFSVFYKFLPAVTLGTSIATTLARILRSSMLEVIRKEYVITAYSKGLSKFNVIKNHILRNSLIAITTVFGLQFAWILGGSVIVEEVFAWPGMGRLILKSVLVRDYAVVQAGVFIFALIVMFTNLLVDIIYAYLDPRIRYK